jgi:shikimate kinase
MTDKANIILIGPMGAGKSTIGRQLAAALHLPFRDSDREIEKRTGVDIPTIFEFEGEEGFRDRESAMLEALCAERGVVLATGGGAVMREGTAPCFGVRPGGLPQDPGKDPAAPHRPGPQPPPAADR